MLFWVRLTGAWLWIEIVFLLNDQHWALCFTCNPLSQTSEWRSLVVRTSVQGDGSPILPPWAPCDQWYIPKKGILYWNTRWYWSLGQLHSTSTSAKALTDLDRRYEPKQTLSKMFWTYWPIDTVMDFKIEINFIWYFSSVLLFDKPPLRNPVVYWLPLYPLQAKLQRCYSAIHMEKV